MVTWVEYAELIGVLAVAAIACAVMAKLVQN